jgi:acetoin utilization protein AcuC
MTASFIYTEKMQEFDYGGDHPLKMVRLKLTHELLKAYGVFSNEGVEFVETMPATRKEVESVHNSEFIDVLKGIDDDILPEDSSRYGLGYGDNPAFKGVFSGSMLSTGASLQAAKLVHSGNAKSAFNIAGGLHHAMPGRASGFCYINDPAVAIQYLIDKSMKVAYIDIDAHHGDGVQKIFYETDRVLTISLHEDGHYLFPGTGSPEESGIGKGLGFSVNLPLLPGTGDDVFTWGFFELVPPLIAAFRPDIIVTQLGCDSFATDPLAHLNVTTNGFTKMVEWFKKSGIPWVGMGGGGYDVANVARAWSLAFSIMAGVKLPDELPASYVSLIKENGLSGKFLRDEPLHLDAKELKAQRSGAEEMLSILRKNIFPIHGIKS